MLTLSSSHIGWLALPTSARAQGAQAEAALLAGAPASVLTAHLDEALVATPDDREGADAALDFYKRLLRLSRNANAAEGSSLVVLDHLRRQRRQQLQPDAVVGHLITTALVRSGQAGDALATLAALRADGVALSTGSFDMLIQAAGRKRDRRAAYASFRGLRRARLLPTAYTLNALLNAETRSGQPEQALALLRKAEGGRPHWRGTAPDAWSYATAMAAALAAEQPATALRLFARVSGNEKLHAKVTPAAYNLAIEAKLALGDTSGAKLLLQRMLSGARGAPYPRTRRAHRRSRTGAAPCGVYGAAV
jgi:hypothetical protein